MVKYWKRILWTACVLFLCVTDQRIGSSTGEPQLIFSSCVVLITGIFILTHYSLRDYLKPPYAVWAAFCAVAAPAAMIWGRGRSLYPGRFNIVVCILVLYGFILIRTLIAFIVEKRKPGINPWFLGMFGIMILLMAFSRYNDRWPLMYLAGFFLFYLTGQTKEEKNLFLCALQDGIIAGFFLIQGLAFIFRPYDTLRYMGMYANTNMNALFYQAAYCAFLSKFCVLEVRRKENGAAVSAAETIWKWACFALAAAMWSFVFLTMCRSAFLGMGTATVLAGIYCLKHCGQKHLLQGIRYAILLLAVTIAGFPVVYSAVRYLPPVFHHPVWFYNDYSEERVHSSDPWNSPKYTDWRDVLQENLGRFSDLLPASFVNGASRPQDTGEDAPASDTLTAGENHSAEENSSLADSLSPAVTADSSPDFTGASSDGREDTDMPEQPDDSSAPADPGSSPTGESLSGQEDPQASQEAPSPEELKSTSARLAIYSHYLTSLNLTGHLEQENGLQVSEDYYAPHAHNLFLQYAFNYGLPVGILFFLWIAASGIRLLADVFRSKRPSPSITALLLFAAAVIFGLTEIMWRNGLLSNTLIFLLPFYAWSEKP